MRVYVEGVGLAGPGLPGWPAGRLVLAGVEAYVPAPTVVGPPRQLPAAEGRRTGMPVRLALAVAHEAFTHAGRDAASTATVFTSSSGDGDNVHVILEILASPQREVSPTRFHNSVHNAAAGYWSIACRSHEPSTSLCGYDTSFATGLLEAATQIAVEGKSVGLIAYDHPYPEPLHAKRPLMASFAAAMILTPESGERTLAVLDVEIACTPPGPVTAMADPGLEALRNGVPAARCLPLLSTLARDAREIVGIQVRGRRLPRNQGRPMPIGRDEIAAMIPHAGRMCLLDRVTHWDTHSVSASSRTHRDADNPLRTGGRLWTLSAIEYAAQAMAVHGGLAGTVSARPRAGYLVSLRRVVCHVARLDDLEGDLVIEARQLIGDAERVMYAFSLRVGNDEVLSGNATVVLDAGVGAT